MTTKELLDLARDHFLMIGSADAANTTWRQRAQERAQEVVEEVWDEGDWDFKASGAVTLTDLAAGDSSVDAPADLATIGENGGLYITGLQFKLDQMNPNQLRQRFQELSQGTGRPQFYSVIGQNATSLVSTIQFDVVADTAYPLTLYYDRTPPVLLDAPTALTGTVVAGNGLSVGTYHYKVTFTTSTTESELGAASAALTTVGANKNISLVFPTGAASTVTGRKIYRTVADGNAYFHLITFADNATTTYTDTIGDGSLTVPAPTTVSNLLEIPQEYHRSVLQKGLLSKLGKDFNDPRVPEFEAQYRAELARMKSRRVPGLESLDRIGDGGLPLWGMY